MIRALFTTEEIAHSYAGTHVTVWNIPSDDEWSFALRINGHSADKLDSVKAEYVRLVKAFGAND